MQICFAATMSVVPSDCGISDYCCITSSS